MTIDDLLMLIGRLTVEKEIIKRQLDELQEKLKSIEPSPVQEIKKVSQEKE
jgi:hypothetical protein